MNKKEYIKAVDNITAPQELVDRIAALEQPAKKKAPLCKTVTAVAACFVAVIIAFSGIVGREKVSVEDMEKKVEAILKRAKRVKFSKLFRDEDSRPEMIATFLAILEMIKLSKISADYDDESGEFIISHK